jgi:2-oxoglutarate decarboxylase
MVAAGESPPVPAKAAERAALPPVKGAPSGAAPPAPAAAPAPAKAAAAPAAQAAAAKPQKFVPAPINAPTGGEYDNATAVVRVVVVL